MLFECIMMSEQKNLSKQTNKNFKNTFSQKLCKLNQIKIGFNIFQMISYFRLGFNFGFKSQNKS